MNQGRKAVAAATALQDAVGKVIFKAEAQSGKGEPEGKMKELRFAPYCPLPTAF
jgi:hypothetical protein